MRIFTTGQRLKHLMSQRNLKQVDILNKTLPLQSVLDVKMDKTNLSQYVNDKSRPDQPRTYLLAKALDVSEPWLMGYDVDMERIPDEKRTIVSETSSIMHQLHEPRQEKVLTFAKDQLTEQEREKLKVITPDPKWEVVLTKKDERDIERELEALLSDTSEQGHFAAYGGKQPSEMNEAELEDFEKFKGALRETLRIAKRINKEKHTPHKYRGDG